MSPLVIPKKRSLTKSISIGGSGSSASSAGLANYSSSPRLKRVASSTSRPSPQPSLRTTSRPILKPTRPPKLSTSQELFLALCKYNKTSKIVNTWGSIESFATQPIQTSIDILNRTNNLTSFERAEISKHHEIYYIGANTGFNSSIIDSSQNFGYDDKNHNLKISLNDHINYRFQVIANLGCGMFGNVIKCKDHKQSRIVSLKVMKNDINWQLQSLNEIKILRSLTGHPNILSYIDHFNFRSHICVVTEMLAVNLIEALEATKFQGFEMNVIKHWSKQLLSGLQFMHGQGIIHCDLKPENIMLISPDSFDLKIIDFGSSAYKDELTYPYIQSRFYRAPEVLLGARYTTQIDIWSFGCVIYEMYKGRPLFPAKDELGLYKMFVKLLGHPSPRAVSSYRNEVIEKGSICAPSSCKTESFIDKKAILFTCFDRLGTYNGIPLEPFRREPLSRKLGIDDGKFMNFLQNILVWNQAERRNAQQLLHHEFLNLD
ncbi:hypothetical protein WICPIJ_003024 [Wickerhamomyces pijperi]|uniref:Protein kinase domain-containing protein n=1 Tax=Wickerhamomyces pijperi TaxID=599730 RepID=A0A9P8QAS1_WICPI|nr:hypothetical protein WICPIJ_003024 [Wickerhamomyces pijperi]